MRLKLFVNFERLLAYAHQRADSGDTYQRAQMTLLDASGNYTRLGVIGSGREADRFRGIEWDAIDWTDAGPVDGAVVAMLQSYVGRRKGKKSSESSAP